MTTIYAQNLHSKYLVFLKLFFVSLLLFLCVFWVSQNVKPLEKKRILLYTNYCASCKNSDTLVNIVNRICGHKCIFSNQKNQLTKSDVIVFNNRLLRKYSSCNIIVLFLQFK